MVGIILIGGLVEMQKILVEGRKVLKSEMNNFWPKFYENSEKVFLPADTPDDFPPDIEYVYEPKYQNVEEEEEVLRVRIPEGSFLFSVSLFGVPIVWGATYVTMGQTDILMSGTVLD